MFIISSSCQVALSEKGHCSELSHKKSLIDQECAQSLQKCNIPAGNLFHGHSKWRRCIQHGTNNFSPASDAHVSQCKVQKEHIISQSQTHCLHSLQPPPSTSVASTITSKAYKTRTKANCLQSLETVAGEKASSTERWRLP